MKTLHFAAMISAATLMLATAVACSDTETEYVTAPSVSVAQAVVQADQAGGSYTAAVSVTNPVDGATISASPSASWVTVTSCTETAVALSVSENANEDPRTARVTVSYSYTLAGSKGTASCEITVAQGNADQPILSVQPTAVAAAIEGGAYSFEYTIVNPASDGEVSASCTASWISDIDASEDGEVSFTVAENTATTLRQAEITLTYSWGNGSLSESVTVVQDHQGGSGDDSGSGGGDFDGDIDSLVGTYTAGGYAYGGQGVATYTTWTLTIYKTGDNEVTIDGLTPESVGHYPTTGAYAAKASLNSNGQLVIPSQFTGYYDSNGQIGWTPCTRFETGNGWYRDSSGPDCTLTYDPSTDIWTSDYGMFLAIFSTSGDFTSWLGFYDVTNPGFQITKGGDLPDNPGDGGSGGGGDVDLSEFVGTYSCSGYVYNEDYNGYNSQSVAATWTMKIYDHGDGQLLLSGLVPDTVDYYPYDTGDGKSHDNGPYTAYATVSGNNIRVSYPQWTGWNTNIASLGGTVYICWVCCPQEGYYNSSSGTLTFEYDSASGSWTSDVGLWLGLCTSNSILTNDTFASYYDFFLPGMTITKTSSSTGAAPSALKSLNERTYHTGAKAAPASATSTGFVTRSLSTLPLGSAKLAK